MSDWNEATTRTELIDPALERAGWDVHDREQVGLEIPVDGTSPEAWQAQLKILQGVARFAARIAAIVTQNEGLK